METPLIVDDFILLIDGCNLVALKGGKRYQHVLLPGRRIFLEENIADLAERGQIQIREGNGFVRIKVPGIHMTASLSTASLKR